MESLHVCPVCGFQGLRQQAWPDVGMPSFEICPSCGIQFGYDDMTCDLGQRQEIHQAWRKRWMRSGMNWWSRREPPPSWDPVEQMRSAGIDLILD
jgi:predicted RNA-binding Zn-ribbon protein involved in translation (DUF1610 family)